MSTHNFFAEVTAKNEGSSVINMLTLSQSTGLLIAHLAKPNLMSQTTRHIIVELADPP